MRTTIIPAQITTVEDRIAGSFNLAQILILMIPVFWTALIYALLPPTMKIVVYKLVAILIVLLICIILIIRIKEKIILSWLIVIFRYHFRPKYYLFNKNNLTNRDVDYQKVIVKEKVKKTETQNKEFGLKTEMNIADQIMLEHLINEGKVALNYKFESKK